MIARIYWVLGLLAVTFVAVELATKVDGLGIGSFVGAITAAALLVVPAVLAWRDLRVRSKPAVWFSISPRLHQKGDDAPYAITDFWNPSDRPADCLITLSFSMRGEKLRQNSLGDQYNGREPVLVPPRGFHGNFSLKKLLLENDLSSDGLRNQPGSDAGCPHHLRVSVSLKYRHTGTKEWLEDMPKIRYYFDFQKRVWVYDA